MNAKLYVMKEYNGTFRWKYDGPVENPVVAIEPSEISDWATFTFQDGTQKAVRFACDGIIIKLEEEDK